MNISINQQNFTGCIKRGNALRNAFRTMPKEILKEFTTLEKNAIKTNDNKVLDFFEKQVIKGEGKDKIETVEVGFKDLTTGEILSSEIFKEKTAKYSQTSHRALLKAIFEPLRKLYDNI